MPAAANTPSLCAFSRCEVTLVDQSSHARQVFYIASAKCAEPAVLMVREAAKQTRGLSVQMVWVQAEEEFAQVRLASLARCPISSRPLSSRGDGGGKATVRGARRSVWAYGPRCDRSLTFRSLQQLFEYFGVLEDESLAQARRQ